jgi:hypothetical protein
MRLIPLSSSNLSSYEYDATAEELYITFQHGGRYKYNGISQNVADGLGEASSPGSYFQSEIKGAYGYSKA